MIVGKLLHLSRYLMCNTSEVHCSFDFEQLISSHINSFSVFIIIYLKPVPPEIFSEKDSDNTPDIEDDADDKGVKSKVRFNFIFLFFSPL